MIHGTLSADGRPAEAGWEGALVLCHRCWRKRLNFKVGEDRGGGGGNMFLCLPVATLGERKRVKELPQLAVMGLANREE